MLRRQFLGAADTFGTAKALSLENNTFTSSAANGFGITDTDVGGGARFVARFNTVTNGSFQTHGTESTGRDRGVRGMEVYSNSVTVTSGAQGQIAGWRSGAFLLNNTVTGPGQFNSGASMANYRSNNDFPPWARCDGQGPYDNNNGVTYATGTITSTSLSGTSLSVTDTSKSWNYSQWVTSPPYSVVDISITDFYGAHPGAEIDSSTSNSITPRPMMLGMAALVPRHLIMVILTRFYAHRPV